MKKLLLPLFILAITMTSCMKEATCTCKTASGTVLSTQTKKSTSKSDVEKFKTDCSAMKTQEKVNGVVVSTTPCEVS
ncbi:MAG: hypothetical protein KBG47_12210 [Bacteroidia bacterium]|nr:hypothetical protein [Sphingobacteriaceae bacterium]MBK7818734.1 hypothetical protein [Sphingobacteriaceae bacterium]MBP9070265.1 hypothetical protein [Bacteroidia bacterium]